MLDVVFGVIVEVDVNKSEDSVIFDIVFIMLILLDEEF